MHANVSGALLADANLDRAYLWYTNLSGADLTGANLSGTNLEFARMDATTLLSGARLDNRTCLADVVWNGVPLARLNWPDVTRLGEEEKARLLKHRGGKREAEARLRAWADAVRAYRQVATVLRSQGLNEHADRFAYRSQLCQRKILWRNRRYGAWLFSSVLNSISGYGYRLGRMAVAYGLILLVFAAAYFGAGQISGQHLAWYEALLVSFTAIHGRVFIGQFGLDSLLSWVAGVEAVFGIVIEGVFVAMLVQRFFAAR
jgi:hypothetical protein